MSVIYNLSQNVFTEYDDTAGAVNIYNEDKIDFDVSGVSEEELDKETYLDDERELYEEMYLDEEVCTKKGRKRDGEERKK